MDSKEIDYWCGEYPTLNRDEVVSILELLDVATVKEEFWEQNPNLEEETVNDVVKKNIDASYQHHQYKTLNNEAP
jgi:hypothetical protein